MKNEFVAPFIHHRLLYRVLHVVVICCLFSVSSLSAQVHTTAHTVATYQVDVVQYQSYQSVVYEPFTTLLPSESNPVYASGEQSSNKPTNRQNSFITPDDPNKSDESPVGEAWVMLFFAAVAAVGVYRKRRKAIEE